MTGWGTANKAVCQTSNSFSLTAWIFIFLSDHLVGNPTSQQSPLVHKCSVKHSSPVVTVNVRLIILILLGRVGTEAQTLLIGQKQNITGPGGDSLGNRGQSFVLYNSDKREKTPFLSFTSAPHVFPATLSRTYRTFPGQRPLLHPLPHVLGCSSPLKHLAHNTWCTFSELFYRC